MFCKNVMQFLQTWQKKNINIQFPLNMLFYYLICYKVLILLVDFAHDKVLICFLNYTDT